MKDLQDSIKKYGIITPVIVRPRKEGYYEIISGHRRIFAAEKLGYRKVPTIIRYMTDDQAVIAMVDGRIRMYQALQLKQPEGVHIPGERTVYRVMEEIGLNHKPKRKPNGITKADKETYKSVFK